MAKEIEVIFVEEKKGSFRLGQRKRVKLGYARNYLLPKNYAVVANKENETKIQAIEKKAIKHKEELKKTALAVQKSLNNQKISFKVKSHDEGKLYGSISLNDIVEETNKTFKTEIDKHDLKNIQTIKEIGEYIVSVAIHTEVKINMTVIVEPEEDKKAKAKKTSKKESVKEEASTETDTETTNEETA